MARESKKKKTVDSRTVIRTAVLVVLLLVLILLVRHLQRGPDSEGRVAVSGSVTFDGKPVVAGSILFAPAHGTSDVGANVEITDGRYDIPKSAGPNSGTYTVTITNGLNEKFPEKPQPKPTYFQVERELFEGDNEEDFELILLQPVTSAESRLRP